MILETISVGSMQVNCYILASKEGAQAIIIDPGAEVRKIKQVMEKYRLSAAFIINTHGHYDHIGADNKLDVPVYIHTKDADFLKDPQLNLSGKFFIPYQVKSQVKTLEDNQIIELEDIKLKVLHIPGHTPGGIALLMLSPDTKAVFTGDTLFYQSIGRSDLPGGNQELLIESIREKLLVLSDDTVIYPGHGPFSTIGDEKRDNPFLVKYEGTDRRIP